MSQAKPGGYETLLVERRERVAIITINRPDKRNALNIKTREEGAARGLDPAAPRRFDSPHRR